jgi:hypothetical protein
MADIRELTSDERGILACVLSSSNLSCAEELAGQVPKAMVVGGLPTSLHLRVESSTKPAHCKDGPIPVRAFVEGRDGNIDGEVLVWIKDGYLSGLEFAWFTDEAPAGLPAPEQLRIGTSETEKPEC